MSKAKGGLDNKKWESVGDCLIDLVIYENLHKLPEKIFGQYAPHYLASNKHLATVRDREDFPFRVKDRSKVIPVERKGDEVEYYIAFLYFNYGIEKAKKFIKDKIINVTIGV